MLAGTLKCCMLNTAARTDIDHCFAHQDGGAAVCRSRCDSICSDSRSAHSREHGNLPYWLLMLMSHHSRDAPCLVMLLMQRSNSEVALASVPSSTPSLIHRTLIYQDWLCTKGALITPILSTNGPLESSGSTCGVGRHDVDEQSQFSASDMKRCFIFCLQNFCWRVHPGRTVLLLLFLLFLLAAVQALVGLATAHAYLAWSGQTTYELLKGQHLSMISHDTSV